MKKTVYLHVGATKTGTSSVQQFLSKHRKWLSKSGLFVPESQYPAHHPLAQSIIRDVTGHVSGGWKKFRGTHTELWREACDGIDKSGCGSAIISSEYFRNLVNHKFREWADEMLAWLARQLENYNVRVVCYLRPLDQQLKSQYKQHVKEMRLDKSLAQWLDGQVKAKSVQARPTICLDSFAKHFGFDNIYLRHYDKNQLVNGNIVDDVLDLVGFPSQPDARSVNQASNPSLTDEQVDAKRILNAVGRTHFGGDEGKLGATMAKFGVSGFAARPADGGKWIRDALQAEHDELARVYGFFLGEVGDPFSDEDPSSTEARTQAVLIASLYSELRQAQTDIKNLHDEMGKDWVKGK